MSSVGIAVNSKDFWKGSDCIERKLGAVLDRKMAASSKQVLLDRIEFKEASKPDPFYAQLKKKYTPLNSASVRQETNNNQGQNGKKNCEVNGLKVLKNELPAPKFVLFENDKVHLQWKTVRSVGPGLFNLGNTCFLNSVIQVLTYTPPLVNYLATQDHSRKCAAVGFCMLCELQRHVLRTFSHNQNEAIKPLAIIQKLKYIAKHLRFGQQEDSHEFLRYVIDGMMKSCLAGVSEKLDVYTKATTMVHQVFSGYYRSQVTCEKCHHTSNTYDPLMEVLLDIKHAHSLLNALHKLVSVEVLNGDNMYLCPRCKRKVPAKKNLRVHQAPNIMTMCLKRFDSHSMFATKINKEISYPEQLNLRPFMSKNQGPGVHYKLYAVLVHSGYSCNSGHYYSFIKAANNQWYQMNDSSVRQVSLKTVLSQQAYLLFYIKEHNTQKEKNGAKQQPLRNNNTWTINGTKTEGFNQKQHLPKVINEPTKKSVKTQQFPKKPEPPWKQNAPTVRQFTPRPTTIPEQREKITFALNHGTQAKKPNTSQTGEHKESETKAGEEGSLNTETKPPQGCKEESIMSVDRSDKLQVNEVSSSVEEDKKQGLSSATEKNRESESISKDIEKETKKDKDIHATTKWTVTKAETPTTLLPGALLPGARERTPSMSSELSNPGSVASKTGEWSVFDRSATPDVAPRLPERQHAGWKVSKVESPKKENGTDDDSEQPTEKADQGESYKKSKKKRKHSKEKSERKETKPDDETRLLSAESREHSDDNDVDERHREKKKRLRKLEKAKKRKSGQDSSSEDEKQREKRKKHKKSKKKKKQRKEKYEQLSDEGSSSKSERKRSDRSVKDAQEFGEDITSGIASSSLKNEQNSDVSFEKKLGERKDSETDKKDSSSDKVKSEKSRHISANNPGNTDTSFSGEVIKNKEGTAQCSENDNSFQTKSNKKNDTSGYCSEEDEFRTKTTRTSVDLSGKTVVDKGKEFVSKVSERRKKGKGDDRKPLVEYSDNSSSSEEQGSRGKSRVHEDTSKDTRGEKKIGKRVKSWTSEEASRENHERKDVVDMLLVNSRKSSNYGRFVERWDGERGEDSSVRESEENNKRRRDFWDEEYDQGKIKRAKNKDKFHNHSYHGENSFQREYDRKRMRNDGWHSSSSNGWHRRSSDRWRDRR